MFARSRFLLAGFAWASVFACSLMPAFAQSAQNSRYSSKLAPYVASPARVIDHMLEVAKIKPGETLYDLGCGDGGILIAAVQKYKVRAVGVEISPKLVSKAQVKIGKAGLTNQASVIQGDVLTVDFSNADVVTLYLGTQLNAELKPHLEKYLKPGARVVSHDYAIPGWKAVKVETEGKQGHHSIYLYEMPPVKE